MTITALVLGLLGKALWPSGDAFGSSEDRPWDVRVSSAGSSSVVALAYGRSAGLHLLRVPSVSANSAQAALLSASVGDSPLYIISLGRASIEVRAIAPENQRPMAFTAYGRVVQVVKEHREIGVRVWGGPVPVDRAPR